MVRLGADRFDRTTGVPAKLILKPDGVAHRKVPAGGIDRVIRPAMLTGLALGMFIEPHSDFFIHGK